MNAFAVLAAAFRRTWDEWLSVMVLSALWLLAQALIVPGPAATAALFAMAHATHDGVYWGAADAWAAFRSLFWPAWRWALPTYAITGIALYNLSVFGNVPGAGWSVLRLVWLLVLLAWLGLNLFFWPLYLSAEDRSLRNTWANCARFWLLHPGTALVVFAVSLIMGIAAVGTLLPVVLGFGFWLALTAETAVRRSLALAHGRDS